MKYTSAEAAKIIRSLNEELNFLNDRERKISTFTVSLNENIDDIRPEYDYEEFRKNRADLEEKIRKVKHAVSKFNLSTKVPGFDMTIDQLLIYIPQLTARKDFLLSMAEQLPKTRISRRDMIEYIYTNYDIMKAKADYQRIRKELSEAQTALDTINNNSFIEIDI